MPTNKNKIELRSEEVQEILGHIPSRIIRYGITAMVSIVVLLFVGSFFFKYPDILTAPAEIVTINPPANIIARSSGNLTQLFVQDTQTVKKDHVLGIIQNSAKYSSLKQLKNWLNNSTPLPMDSLPLFPPPSNLSLGEIQSTYSLFVKTQQNYQSFLELNYLPNKNTALEFKVIELSKYLKIMNKQVEIKKQDFNLSKSKYYRDSSLFVKEVLSRADLEQSQKLLLKESMTLENTKAQAITTSIQLNELKQQILDNQLEHSRLVNDFKNQLQEQHSQLNSRVAWWYDRYVLQSPICGKVIFNKVWATNQYLNAGEVVFTVIPIQESKKIARVQLPVAGAGKVKSGQQVNLKFEQYPYQEFGMIQARVMKRTKVQSESIYTVELSLPDSLITNYGYTIPFSQRMLANAEIITEDLPLIVRLFNPIKDILKSHVSINEKQTIEDKEQAMTSPAQNKKQILSKEESTEPTNYTPKEMSLQNVNQAMDKYHIIMASCDNKEQAQNLFNQYKSKGYSCLLLPNGKNWFRLSVYSTPNKQNAMQQLNKIRLAEKKDDVWLLKTDNLNSN